MAKTKILVVEDEFVTATDVQMALVGLGYDVPAVVDNGEEAVRLAGELRPSLVLMDIGLAGRMNGIEAGKQIREKFGIPVVFLTGHSDESTFWSALPSEPFGYIVKPFEARAMKYTIEMALHKHESHSKAPRKGILKKLAILFVVLGIALFIALVILYPVPARDAQYRKNVDTVKGIAREYYSTHTYLGVETGQSSDVYVCIDMSKDVWNMLKTRGINAEIMVGNVDRNVTTMTDADHAWVLAEVAPMQWLAIEVTGGYVVTKDENPRYYTGKQFASPADMLEYTCGKGYCWSDTCVDDRCLGCSSGFVLGNDLQCHPA
ncbi:MAG TPA: response regulator [Methanomicrobiales archaeon]|nr:response regulator [Methanomicrobiales archaeon]